MINILDSFIIQWLFPEKATINRIVSHNHPDTVIFNHYKQQQTSFSGANIFFSFFVGNKLLVLYPFIFWLPFWKLCNSFWIRVPLLNSCRQQIAQFAAGRTIWWSTQMCGSRFKLGTFQTQRHVLTTIKCWKTNIITNYRKLFNVYCCKI